MNSYELSRAWFDFCFENPEKITPTHTAFYFFCIEHCNRLGWKEKFGLPMEMTKDALGIKNYKTYSKVFNDIVDFGFIKVIQRSKNQYSSNIVALVKNTKATTKALDKAMIKHTAKQVQCNCQDTVGIVKHYNKEQINILTKNHKEVKVFLKSILDGAQEENIKEKINSVYSLYPSKCPIKNNSTGKSETAKTKIKGLLKTNTVEHLTKVIEWYLNDCKKSKTYIKNFSTFLNNLPDISANDIDKEVTAGINPNDYYISNDDLFGYSESTIIEMCKNGDFKKK